MQLRIKSVSFLLVAGVSSLVMADQAFSQCSGGGSRGGGRPPARSPAGNQGNLMSTGNTNPNNIFALQSGSAGQQQALAMREQMMFRQQQMMAARLMMDQQIAQQRHASQQALHAQRLARADAQRAKRAERIAALRLKNASESGNSRSMLAVQSTQTVRPSGENQDENVLLDQTLVSMMNENPFR